MKTKPEAQTPPEKPADIKELTPIEAVMFIAAQEIVAKGILSPDTAELIVLFAPQPIEVVKPAGADRTMRKTSIDVSIWFSGNVFNGHWDVATEDIQFVGLNDGSWPTNVEKAIDDGRFKIAQTVKNYLKALAVKAGIMKNPASSLIIH